MVSRPAALGAISRRPSPGDRESMHEPETRLIAALARAYVSARNGPAFLEMSRSRAPQPRLGEQFAPSSRKSSRIRGILRLEMRFASYSEKSVAI